MFTNLNVYLAIAEEAHEEACRLYAAGRRRKPDGSPGHIVTYDPSQSSFKHSLIAIIFAGTYLEALLYLEGNARLGKAAYGKIDRKTYEAKLEALGVKDKTLLSECEAFRTIRNDLVHEKAHEPSLIRAAQDEAMLALSLIRKVKDFFEAN